LAASPDKDPEETRRAVASYVRERTEQGIEPERLETGNFNQIALRQTPLEAAEKVDRLLRLLAKDTPFPSATVKARPAQYSLLLRTTDQETEYLLLFLSKAGLLDRTRDGQLVVAVPGWQKLWKEQ
jgi:hypothetical protein